MTAPTQLSIFDAVREVYAQAGDSVISNEQMYTEVAHLTGLGAEDFAKVAPIGRAKSKRSPLKRAARWAQQTLKMQGLIERLEGQRGAWTVTGEGKVKLTRIERKRVLIAFSTKLGVALWGHCEDVFSGLQAPIDLCFTSPPYPLGARQRAYGNPAEHEYVDFICRALEPIVERMAETGSVCLNISNDIFVKGSPARSLYRERLVLAMYERLGLWKMDEWVWVSNKPPGPVMWASIKRQQLNVGYEVILWFAKNPKRVDADNRRVLQPHTRRHKQFVASGGVQREEDHSDGAYRKRLGAYSQPTAGKIPRNVIEQSNFCPGQRQYKAAARALGLPAHGASFPEALAHFAISYLTQPGQLVAEPFGGSLTTAVAAEALGRRWLASDIHAEYVRGGACRFEDADGFWLNPDLDTLFVQPDDRADGGAH